MNQTAKEIAKVLRRLRRKVRLRQQRAMAARTAPSPVVVLLDVEDDIDAEIARLKPKPRKRGT